MKQTCNHCNVEKDISKFEWQKGRPNPRKTCKKCRNKLRWENIKSDPNRHREWLDTRNAHRNDNKDLYKSRWMKSIYGIALEDFNDIIESQDYKCAICNKEFTNSKSTHLDHNHKTGKVRGALCGQCNSGIGMLQDDVSVLVNAIKYLEDTN